MANIEITTQPPTVISVTNDVTRLNITKVDSSAIVLNIANNKYTINVATNGGVLTITAA